MGSAGFDTLRFSRGLRDVGVPEQQADRQAELMAEALGTFADNLVTKDYFSEVLEARLREHGARLEQRIDDRMSARFAEQDARFEARFTGIEGRFTGIEGRLTAIEERLLRIDERFLGIDERFFGVDARFGKIERTLFLHTWMLGLITLVLVVPQLQAWFA
jgi:hypothetical protein